VNYLLVMFTLLRYQYHAVAQILTLGKFDFRAQIVLRNKCWVRASKSGPFTNLGCGSSAFWQRLTVLLQGRF